MSDREMLRKALEISSLFEGLCFEENWFFRDFKREDIISEEQNGVACIGLILRGSAKVAPGEQGAVSTIGRGAEFGICNIFDRITVLRRFIPISNIDQSGNRIIIKLNSTF